VAAAAGSTVIERDLVVRAQQGDVEAFSALTAPRGRQLFSVARMVVRDDDLAADALQDALLRAWLDVRALRDPDRFDAWLRRILIRACYRVSQRQRSRGVVEIALQPDWEPGTDGRDPDAQTSVVMRDQLDRAFRRLSADQRAVIVLHHYLGLSLVEAADTLGIPLGTLRSRLHRATAAMRAAVDADDRTSSFATELVP
jgi:RNA polymerase sigma-70 factor, ECF subfamily